MYLKFHLQTSPIYAAIFSFAFLLLSGAAVIKDSIFADASKKLNGQKLDLVSFPFQPNTTYSNFRPNDPATLNLQIRWPKQQHDMSSFNKQNCMFLEPDCTVPAVA